MPLVNLAHLTPTFDDEFNSFVSSPNGSIGWSTSYAFGSTPGNPVANVQVRTLPNELEYYSDASVGTNPFSDTNGVLDIQAAPAAPGSNTQGKPYTSGIITTYGDFSQLYGYFEVRAEEPAGAGLFPAFWLLPADNSGAAEIDAAEIKGNDTNTVANTAINDRLPTQATSTVANLASGFHTFGVDWEPVTTTYYVDGVAVAALPTPAAADTAMYLLLNLAIGAPGSYAGTPDASTAFPANLLIDYVRAYATGNTLAVNGSAALTAAATTAPTLLGEFGPQSSVTGTGAAPFAAAKVIDAAGVADTALVTLSDPSHGTLTGLTGWQVSGAGYSFTGSAAAVTAALRGLVFQPAASGSGTVTTTFSLAVRNANAAAATVSTALSETPGVLSASAQTVDGTLAPTGAPAGAAPLAFTDTGRANTILGGVAGLAVTVAGSGGDTIITHAGSTNAVVLNTTNDVVESYGNDTINGTGTYDWVQAQGAYNTTAYTGTHATLDVLGTAETFFANGQFNYITVRGAQAVILNGFYDYLSADAGLVTLYDGGSYSTILGGSGGLAATLAATGDIVRTLAGATDTIVVAAGSGNTVYTTGTDAITLKAGGNVISAAGVSTIYDAAGGNTIWLGGAATVAVSGTADLITVSGAATDAITVANNSTVSGGGGVLTVAATGSGARIVAGSGITNVGEGAGPVTVQFGSGKAYVYGGLGGADTYAFVAGSGGGQDTVYGFRAGVDHLVFSGFSGSPVRAEAVAGGTLTATLQDGTTLLLAGVTNPSVLPSPNAEAGGDGSSDDGGGGGGGGVPPHTPINYYVNPGQVTAGLALSGGDAAFVFAGGSVSNTTVTSGGLLVVAGGAAAGSTVLSGGSAFLQGGADSGGTVSSGGALTVSGGVEQAASIAGSAVVYGGAVVSATVLAGGQLVELGGTVSGTSVAGSLTVSGGVDTGSVLGSGGMEFLAAGAVGSGATVSSGGVQIVLPGGVASGTQLLAGGRLDLAAVSFAATSGFAFAGSSGVLSFQDAGAVQSVTLRGDYTGLVFQYATDAQGGLAITATLGRSS